ncbi:NFACT RNA binding domain-containing protein [Fodinisporobacter ferrooxydans]|uniref:Rqc2 homolog RqcH n=1 Tax=Fodinisporobacter ferrooxydans TaxID=2901836 RepID=A0ABY4CMV9_9BACL|nr:NFACT RNA binding domain-containing protein [Alicyclobacillaceae bacterium MYW30-H2]
MAFDGIVLRAVRAELSSHLLGARIEKIYQPLPRDLVLQLRSHGRTYRLLLSANPTYPRVLLIDRYQGQNPAMPPMFCMVLRKHLEGGILRSIEQPTNERMLRIRIESTDELGERVQRLLVIELMGRHSNLILLDPKSKTIFDSIVHITHAISRHREVLPGRSYIAPPTQDKADPFALDEGMYQRLRSSHSDIPLSNFLSRQILGISQLLARELSARIGEATMLEEWKYISATIHSWRQDQFAPTVKLDAETAAPLAFSILPLQHLKGADRAFASISQCLEWFYAEKVRHDMIQQKAGDLLRILKTELERNHNKIEKLKEELQIAEQADVYRLYGELITASLYQFKRGDAYADVTNFYEDDMPLLRIELDPLLEPIENAQAYFKKYNKAKQSVPHIKEQLALAANEVRYLEEVTLQIEQAALQELDEIRDELEQGGYVKGKSRTKKFPQSRNKQKNGRTPPAVSLERYLTPEGIELVVGKNNKQNDYISTKLAKKTDTWLHVKDIPGSHVIIRGKEFSADTLRMAAQVAAFFSKGRDSSRVPVDYTLIKHTWKPNGAKPGMILYENQQTLFVRPSLEGVQKLERS